MPQPTEHKSVQARILKYAEEIGWSVVSRSEAEERRGFASTNSAYFTGAKAFEAPMSDNKKRNINDT